MFFDGNDFVAATAAAVVAVVVYFKFVDFVVNAAGFDVAAIHTLFVDWVLAVAETVVVVVVVDVVVVVIVDLRQFGHFFLLIKNQTLSIEFP